MQAFKTESELLIQKGVKAAGPRARKSTVELEKLLEVLQHLSNINLLIIA
ncbi:MAG TPA: histone H1 [Flavobacterium sp.]